MMSPETFTPTSEATVRAALPRCGTSVAKPWPSTTVFARPTVIGWDRSYTPGVSTRFFPAASSALIARTGVAGDATKNDDSGTDFPASLPLAQDVPDERVWTAGTKTR